MRAAEVLPSAAGKDLAARDANKASPRSRRRRTETKEPLWLSPEASKQASLRGRAGTVKALAPRHGAEHADWSDARYQAFALLRIAFTVAPIAFGLDKFFNVLVDWPIYLAPWINDIAPGSGQDFMYFVGATEILAGVHRRAQAPLRRLRRRRLAGRNRHQPPDRLGLLRHRPARLRAHARRPHARPARLRLRPPAAPAPPLTNVDRELVSHDRHLLAVHRGPLVEP